MKRLRQLEGENGIIEVLDAQKACILTQGVQLGDHGRRSP